MDRKKEEKKTAGKCHIFIPARKSCWENKQEHKNSNIE